MIFTVCSRLQKQALHHPEPVGMSDAESEAAENAHQRGSLLRKPAHAWYFPLSTNMMAFCSSATTLM